MKNQFLKELKKLEDKKIITPQVAINISNYYNNKTSKNNNILLVIFGVLGASLVGLGIILILAHNWDTFPKLIKTFLAFCSLLIGQLFVVLTLFKFKKNRTWQEASGVFLFFSIGACIALIGQIYNISGNFNTYILCWILLACPLIYILNSYSLGIFHIICLTLYVYTSNKFTNTLPWLYFSALLIILPFYITLVKQNANGNLTGIYNWLIAISICMGLNCFLPSFSKSNIFIYMLLFGVFYNIGTSSAFNTNTLRGNAYTILGNVGIVCLLLASSFMDTKQLNVNDLFLNNIQKNSAIILFVVSLLLLFALKNNKTLHTINYIQIVPLLFILTSPLNYYFYSLYIIVINVLILLFGILTLKKGIKQLHFGILNYGLGIITLLIVSRFLDNNINFIIRGLSFIGIGIGFFMANIFMLKAKKII